VFPVGEREGLTGWLAVLVLVFFLARGVLTGLGGVAKHVSLKRCACLGGLAAAGLAFLAVGTVEDSATGAFQLRCADRAEARAPFAGFLDGVCVREGEYVRAGAVVARLRVPNLGTRLGQAEAEVREGQARLALLLAGPRCEEREARRVRERQAEAALERARQDLGRAHQALGAELEGMAAQLAGAQAEAGQASAALRRARQLRMSSGIAREVVEEQETRWQVAVAQTSSLLARLRARRLLGTQDAEREVFHRERELAEARSALYLSEAGARAEEVEAEKARLARAREEVRFLRQVEASLTVRAGRSGQVTTAGLGDRVGRYLAQGELICTIEQPGRLEAEVLLLDQQSVGVREGQQVQLRPCDQPWLVLRGTVERLAPRAVRGGGEPTSTVMGVHAHCRVDEAPEAARPGSVGHARVLLGRRPVRTILHEKAMALWCAAFWW
jgi:multidrug resistance efflux pump